jgi:hypothetical protein
MAASGPDIENAVKHTHTHTHTQKIVINLRVKEIMCVEVLTELTYVNSSSISFTNRMTQVQELKNYTITYQLYFSCQLSFIIPLQILL